MNQTRSHAYGTKDHTHEPHKRACFAEKRRFRATHMGLRKVAQGATRARMPEVVTIEGQNHGRDNGANSAC